MSAHLRLQQQAGRARVGSLSNDYMRSSECCGTVGDRHHLHCMASVFHALTGSDVGQRISQ